VTKAAWVSNTRRNFAQGGRAGNCNERVWDKSIAVG
jgi:hypothetical protein